MRMSSNGKKLTERVDDRSGTAIPGVDHDFQRAQDREVDKAEQAADVPGRYISRSDGALHRQPRQSVIADSQLLKLPETAVAADWSRPSPDELQPVIIGRIMAGRHHNAAVQVEMGRA